MEIDYENVGVSMEDISMDVDEEGFEYEDTDDIDLKDLENEAWLIKLPAYLFDKWADVADDDTELARVQFFVDSRYNNNLFYSNSLFISNMNDFSVITVE